MALKNVHPTIIADIKKRNNYADLIKVVKYDSIRFIVLMMDGGKPFTSGQMEQIKTVSMVCLRKDGVPVFLNGVIVGDNQIIFDISRPATEQVGEVRAMVQLYDADGNRVSSLSFNFVVVADFSGVNPPVLEHEQTLIEVVLGDGPRVIREAIKATEYANLAGDTASMEADRAKVEADYIEGKRPLIEQSIADAAQAKMLSDQANTKSTHAVEVAETVERRFDEVLAFTGDGNPEVVDARGGHVNLNARLDGFTQQFADAERQTQTLQSGLNVLNADVVTPVDFEAQGRTIINLLGKDGNPTTGNWSQNGWYGDAIGIYSMVDGGYYEGTRKFRFHATDSSYAISHNVNSEFDKKYLISFYAKKDGGGKSRLYPYGSNLTIENDGVWRRYFHKVTGDQLNGKLRMYLGTYGTNEITDVSAISLYEITESEYNKIGIEWDDAEVARRYPYVDSVQHLVNPYVMAEGSNLIPPFTEWSLHANAKVISPYELELNATGINQFNSIDLEVLPNTNYSISGGGDLNALSVSTLDGRTSLASYLSPKPITFNTAGNKLIRIHFSSHGLGSGKYVLKDPMLTLGSSPKPFVPRNPSYLYAETKLGAIGDKRDILFQRDGKWHKRKVIEKDVVLDGVLVWKTPSAVSAGLLVQVDSFYGSTYSKAIIGTTHSGVSIKGVAGSEENQNTPYSVRTAAIHALQIVLPLAEFGFPLEYSSTANDIKRYFNGWKYSDGTVWTSVTGNGQTATAQQALDTMPSDYTPYKLSYVLANPVEEEIIVEGDIVADGLTQMEIGAGFTHTTNDEGKREYTLLPTNQRYNVTVNPVDVKAVYSKNLRTAHDEGMKKLSDGLTQLSIHERSILDLYVKVKALEGTL